MIRNKTRKTILIENIERSDSFFRKAKGLMFRCGLDEDGGMLFTFSGEGRVGIWMLFMRFPIDLVFLDSKKRVTDIFEGIKPVSLNPKTWKVYYPSAPSRYALELSQGTVKRTGTRTGDLLEFD